MILIITFIFDTFQPLILIVYVHTGGRFTLYSQLPFSDFPSTFDIPNCLSSIKCTLYRLRKEEWGKQTKTFIQKNRDEEKIMHQWKEKRKRDWSQFFPGVGGQKNPRSKWGRRKGAVWTTTTTTDTRKWVKGSSAKGGFGGVSDAIISCFCALLLSSSFCSTFYWFP